MSSKCLCFTLTSYNCQNWKEEHLPRTCNSYWQNSIISREPVKGCADCARAYISRRTSEAMKCNDLESYEQNKHRREKELDDELEEYFSKPI